SFSVFCLDPLTWFSTGTPGNPTVYTVVGLSNYLTAPIGSDGYAKQFNTVPYTDANISPYYKAQATPGGASSTSVLNKLLELYSHAYASTVNNAVNAAAFQYAIWEIEGETAGSYSRTSGGLTMTAASTSVQTKADNYLAALNGTSTWASLNLSSTSDYNYTVYQATPTGSTQTFLRVTSSTTGNQTNTPVPEPGTGLLAAMAGLVWVGSRRRQAQAGKVV
ncbi:MAG: PEP-CTERM sorting domain-containing protein, partial [Ideonella sp.]|nr:PEP-CTERM sorting domain-containing protein [Ideonella sp.]